jgi:hypothetical protein
MTKFIPLSVFIAYCKSLENNVTFLSTFENSLEIIHRELVFVHEDYPNKIPPKILILIGKYYYLEIILFLHII